MKIKNSTDWPAWFLRRMTSWCARQVGLPPSKVKSAIFTKTARSYRGRAWPSMRILVRIGSDVKTTSYNYKGGNHPALNDRMEALVGVTAHELFHLAQWHEGIRRMWDRCEIQTCAMMTKALDEFRSKRDTLLARWMEAPSESSAQKLNLQDLRRAKVVSDLGRWQRKLKLAQTKVRKLRTRVRYYERRSQCTSGAAN